MWDMLAKRYLAHIMEHRISLPLHKYYHILAVKRVELINASLAKIGGVLITEGVRNAHLCIGAHP